MYGDLLEEMEGPVYTVISECKARVLEELKDEELNQKFLVKINSKFSALEEKTKECNNVATLQNIKIEADTLKVRLLDEIREEYQKILAKRLKEQNDTEIITEGGKKNPPAYVAPPKTKKYHTLSIKDINSETTWILESEADIDKYIDTLRQKLKQNLKEDLILNIEF